MKRAEGGETIGGATGTVRVQRSALTDLEPVRKGKAAEGESKKFTEMLVKTANPLGRMRGETPNSECDRADIRGKEVDRYRRQFVGESKVARDVGGFSHG